MADLGAEFEERPDDLEEQPRTLEEVKAEQRALLRAAYEHSRPIAEIEAESDKLVAEAAGFDTLIPGIHNKLWFSQKLEESAELARRTNGTFTVVMGDLDLFKQLNDTAGHPEGDNTLRRIGAVLLRNTRKTDTVARYGGDEFVILFQNTTALQTLIPLVRILNTIPEQSSRHPRTGEMIPLGISIGIAQFNNADPDETASSVLAAADVALYSVKNSTKGRICLTTNDPTFTSETMFNQLNTLTISPRQPERKPEIIKDIMAKTTLRHR